ncbi:DedA family protein [Pseudaminobacter sp. 19-2017]|uniref:DedA family protein n=1 Tax=Pseudaminobacter soli (ex Zhang et al. 2022) TaxID=2831468 RepID=A0A942DX97_9HYPH|nr:DedA family protein [Pseudaminobacter soli]MBS3647018.1 DedA family protein [Pseudaminobacter soli]
MTDLLHAFIERFGLVAVFIGCLAEGESAAIFGGFFAHQGVFDPRTTALVAFCGAWLGDTVLFLLGRRFADNRWVRAVKAKPGFSKAEELIQRHPDLYILGNRYVYGLRAVGGVAAGLSKVSIMRFVVLNAISAAVWAVLFVCLGYFLGLGAEHLLGKALFKHERLISGIVLTIAIALATYLLSRKSSRRYDPSRQKADRRAQ